MEMQEKLAYNIPELAQALGIGKNNCYQLISRKDFPKIRVGHRIIVPIDALKTWLREQSDD